MVVRINNKKKPALTLLAVLAATMTGVSPMAYSAVVDSQVEVAAYSEIDQLKNAIVPDFVQYEVKSATNSGITLTEKVDGYFHSQLDDGSWPDINYADRSQAGWAPADHLRRLRAMAAAYYLADSVKKKKGPLKRLKNPIRRAIDYWYATNPTSTNWWWGEIGKQLYLGPVALMFEQQLSAVQLSDIIADMPAAPYSNGANRSDLSKLVIYGGLLAKDSQRVSLGITGINESIIVTSGEGIQVDNSFHQHGPQLHNGSYGKVFFNTAIYWAYHVRDLQWKFSDAKTNILSDYFLNGDRWMTRGGTIDYSTGGRSISRPKSDVIDNSSLLKQVDFVAALTPSRSVEADAFKAHLQGAGSGLSGHKHFWRSDYAINMQNDYLFSMHMASNRVATTETGNGENLLGYWLGFGNTFLMLDGDEYQNIFPVWDWKYIPGVTSPAYQGPGGSWGKFLHRSSFVGGVSNGKYGVTTMDMKAMSTKAKKSWFSFADEVVALGAGISSSSELNINTTVNQALLDGSVTVDGTVYAQGQHDLASVNWIHHDKVGYVFPTQLRGVMSNTSQSGSWNQINSNQSTDIITKDVFSLRINHDLKPQDHSYQYILVPGKTAEQVQSYSTALPVTVLENSKNTQAVRHEGLNHTAVVFHKAGSLEVYPGLTVSVDRPSALLLDHSGSTPVVSVSTPGVSGGNLKVCLKQGNEVLADVFAMPALAEEIGKTVTRKFAGVSGNCDPVAVSTILLPTDDAFVRGGAYANQTWGKNGYMVVQDSSNESYSRKSFLRWNLAELDATHVTKAEFRLYSLNVTKSPMTLNFHKTGDGWNENTLTWNNKPASGWLFAKPVIQGSGEWITIDVTDFVNAELAGDSVMSIAIEPETTAIYLGLGTKENAQFKPELVVTY